MSRREHQRLADVLAAVAAIRRHLQRGTLEDDLVHDAVRVRLIEIGEAVKGISADLRAREPDLPWAQIAGMRDHLAHRYFDISHDILQATVDHDLPQLEAAIERLLAEAPPDTDS